MNHNKEECLLGIVIGIYNSWNIANSELLRKILTLNLCLLVDNKTI